MTAVGAPCAGPPTGSSPASPTSTTTPAVLSGSRQVTITRVDGFEAGLSLTDDGRLSEVDDDSASRSPPTTLARRT